jgi:SAM-dependent methyltransferase
MNTRESYPAGVVLEDQPCPNGCPPDDEPVLEGRDRIHGVPGEFKVVQCRHCRLMRTNPRPTPDTIGAYYPDDYEPYRSKAGTKPAKVRKWRHRVKDRIRRFFGRDVRRLPPIEPGHLIEVGCASGDYLLQMRAQGWSTEGIEYSDHAAEQARQHGLQVQTASVETARQPHEPADVVAAWMVLEHLHDPVHALQKIHGWIKPGGYLVGVVPDAGAWDRKRFGTYWYALHLPAHLYHYTPDSFRRILANAGWEVVHLRWQPNGNNLLNTVEYWAEATSRARALRVVRWMKHAKRASTLRRWTGWLLGLTRQSGRMEFWARPIPGYRPGGRHNPVQP